MTRYFDMHKDHYTCKVKYRKNATLEEIKSILGTIVDKLVLGECKEVTRVTYCRKSKKYREE